MVESEYDETCESDWLKCPYCGQEDQDAWEINFNDDKIEIECDCGKKFWGSSSTVINYKGEADCELNGDSHKLEPTNNKGQFVCRICGQYKYDNDALSEKEEVKA